MDNSLSHDVEDSFRVHRGRNTRAIVDSDSDESDDNISEDAEHSDDTNSFEASNIIAKPIEKISSVSEVSNKFDSSDDVESDNNIPESAEDSDDNSFDTSNIIENPQSSHESNTSDNSFEVPQGADSQTEHFAESTRRSFSNSFDVIEGTDDEASSHQSSEGQKLSTTEDARQETPELEIIENSISVVDLSSDEEASAPVTLKQTDITQFLTKPEQKPVIVNQKRYVSQIQYQEQARKIDSVASDLLRTRNAMKVIKLESLPDQGKSLMNTQQLLEGKLQHERYILENMIVDQPSLSVQNKIEVKWEEIEAGVDAVAPRTFGKIGIARFNAEKKMAVDTLDSLHKSLETCPKETDFVDDPKGLKVPLMQHQRCALAWLLWREKQKPSGGILADDMGLGKTLTMISLVLKSNEIGGAADKENYRDKYPGGTLVVCPASLMNQWSGEIEKWTKRGLLSVELHHGAKRETKAKKLAQHDVVITTYTLILNEGDRNGAVFGVRWRRIVLDEAHQIRNHKSKTSEAVFRLSGKTRWSLTGTPVHNKELDMYAQLKFLRCAPFDDYQVWKHWVGDKSSGGQVRLHAVISSLMLRRTKTELIEKGSLKDLPSKSWELVPVKLEKDEMDVYQKVLIFSRTLFAQFLHQRAEKDQDAYDMKFGGAPPDPNGEYFKMRNKLLKLNRVKEVSQHEILVLLLRLRQICCHPSLIRKMLGGDEDLGNADDEEESDEMNLLEQLNRLNIEDEDDHQVPGISVESVGLKEASKGFLNASNPVFQEDRASSKIRRLVDLLKQKVSGDDKAIVVSQWTSLLKLISCHLDSERIPFDTLDGSIPVQKRMPIVDNFNDPNSRTKILMLSLTAGGVGLNLVGANHLFLLDLHWNPQLENQAQDRIYRMGQTKPIFVYKFMALDTIEERIKALQDRKLEIANSMLTGSKRVINSKLSLQDLKMLFEFK